MIAEERKDLDRADFLTDEDDNKIREMRDRFLALQLVDDEDDEGSEFRSREYGVDSVSERSTRRKTVKIPLSPGVPVEAVVQSPTPEKEDSNDSPRANTTKIPSTIRRPSNVLPIEEDSVFLEFLNEQSKIPTPPEINLYEYDGIENIPREEIRIPKETPVDFKSEDFDNIALSINRIPEEALEKQKMVMETEFLHERRNMVTALKTKETDILWREHQARQRVDKYEKEAKLRMEKEKTKLSEAFMKKEAEMGREFRRARETIEKKLKEQQASIKEKYGELLVGTKEVTRNLEVNFAHEPMPIELRVHFLRACKDKLESGSYVLMLTQFDRLGGSPLLWSKIGIYGIGPDKPAVSRTVDHQGRYYNRTLRFDDSVFALCPPRSILKPSNVLVLELFRLADDNQPLDKVVGWTALPMCNERFSVVDGRFRLPMMRGEHSPAVQHFRKMEASIGTDLGAWLCNVYFEIRHLPRDFGDGHRYSKIHNELRLDFLNKKVSAGTALELQEQADRHMDVTDAPEAEGVMNPTAKRDVDKGLFHRKLIKNREVAVADAVTIQDIEEKSKSPIMVGGILRALTVRKPKVVPMTDMEANENNNRHRPGVTKVPRKSMIGHSTKEDVDVLERGYDSEDEFFLHPQQRGKLPGVEAVESRENRQWATAGLEGRHVRRFQSEGSRYDTEAIPLNTKEDVSPQVSPRGPLLAQDSGFGEDLPPWKRLEEADLPEMETFTMAVSEDPARRRKLLPNAIARSKVKFMWQEVFGDFTHGQRGTFEFYMNLSAFIVSFWVRIYIHYLAQYLYLQSIGTPIYGFHVLVYEFSFKYRSDSISDGQEAGVVAMGPLGCLLFFIGMAVAGAAFYRYAEFFPDSASMFVAAFGIWTSVDPILIMLIDLMAQNFNCGKQTEACRLDYTSNDCHCFNGDFVKLWIRMNRTEGSGVSGLLITVMLYVATFVVACLILHEYLVHVHKDARVVDLWRRIHAPAEEFFIPNDFEISQQELINICAAAARWHGNGGQSRKLIVSEYVDRDPYDPDFEEKTVHYAIYELSLSGSRSLYRHFLMLPDGSIIEVFEKLPIGLSSLNKYLETLFEKNRIDGVDSLQKRSDGTWKFGNKHLFAGLENV